jgi:hypothetical protein
MASLDSARQKRGILADVVTLLDLSSPCNPQLTGIILSSTSTFVNPSESNSEWLTRKRLIDPKLKAAGWKIVPFTLEKPLSTQHRKLGISRRNTPSRSP